MKRIFALVLAVVATLSAQTSPSSLGAQSMPVTDAQVQEAVEQYRVMWNKMSSAQQRQTVQAGGYTPESYERMLTQMQSSFVRGGNAPGTSRAPQPSLRNSDEGPAPRRSADYAQRPRGESLQSLETSAQDLTGLRDTNVGRVSKTGCPPEVAMRITELKAKLGVKRAAAVSAASADLADKWNELKPAPFDGSAAERERLLEWVLGVRSSGTPKTEETESQKLDAELLRLVAACPEVR